MDRQSKCLALERKYVYDVYDNTAHYFRDVRYKAWPKVRAFLAGLEPASLVIDVGCGSGKYLHINKEIVKLGCDRSPALIDIAHSRHHEVLTCDNLYLPYRDNLFDAVISIGVIHHLTTKERRVRALRELARILRPGGKLMVYVWAMEQKARKFEAQDVLVPWHLQPSMKQKRKKDVGRLTQTSGEASDEEAERTLGHRARRKSPNPRTTPINRYKGLHHHNLGDGATPCQERRRSFHLTKQNVISHGSTSSCNTPQTSIDASFDEYSSSRMRTRRRSSLKDWVSNLFANPFSSKDMPERKALTEAKPCKPVMKISESEYRKMITQIVKEDLEMFKQHRPMLEHSISAPEPADIFAVREFPQSSQPQMRKNQSLDSHPGRTDVGFHQLNSRTHNVDLDVSLATLEKDYSAVNLHHEKQSTCVSRNASLDLHRHSLGGQTLTNILTEKCQVVESKEHLSGDPCQSSTISGLVSDFSIGSKSADSETSHSHINGHIEDEISQSVNGETYLSQCGTEEEAAKDEHISDRLAMKRMEVPRLDAYLTSSVSCSGDEEGSPGLPNTGYGFCSVDETSSPDTTSPEAMEESSLSSPEDNLLEDNEQQAGLNGLLQEVVDMQYPSLSDSEADEWERVTVKAIQTMKTEVLRHVGTSMDSITSRQAVVGSSCDLEDVDDYDEQRSPRWIDTHVSTSIRQRLTPGGSETSSFSSEPYTESDLDDVDSAKDLHPSPSPSEGPKFEFVFNTDSRTVSASRVDGWSHPRRKYFRRFVSMNEPIMRSDLPSSPPPILEEPNNKVSRCPSPGMKNRLLSADTLPTSPLQDPPFCDQIPPPSPKSGIKASLHSALSSPDSNLTPPHPSPSRSRSPSPIPPYVSADNPSIIIDKPKPSAATTALLGESSEGSERTGSLDGYVDPLPSQSTLCQGTTQEQPADGDEATYHRYYHVFRQGELVTLIENQVDQLHTLESYYDNANWCVVAEKVQVWKI